VTIVASGSLPDLRDLNEATPERFEDAVGPLFERAPRFLSRLAAARPFGSWNDLFDRAEAIALAMPEADQVQLIDGHARLGADPAATAARSRMSYEEQGYHRPTPSAAAESASATAGTASELARLNDAYESHFGFRYVVFVAGRRHDELLPEMTEALQAERGDEIDRALRDVVAIARDRARRLSDEGARP
jgi:2-oxo-4-hydroxy-4-carboxy--5-ureidoimidazoline (OHCU) decarboxylase